MKTLSLLLAIAVILVLSGCTTSGGKVTVSLTPNAAQMIDSGQQVAFTAAVANDSAAAGVTWACTGAACTTLSGVSTTAATFVASSATGTATITATSVKDATATASVMITVSALPQVTTTQTQVTAATAGVAYNLAAAATGGSGTLTWSASGLPADGLSISSSTGAISGTPTSKSTVLFTLTVMDSSTAGPKSASSAQLTLTINNPAAPAITTTQAQLPTGTAGSAYAFTFQATGTGTLTWSAVGLPSDALSLGAGSGAVSGTPTSKATVNFTLTVSDKFGQSSAATPFAITINNPAAPVITTTQAQVTAVPGTAGSHYTFTFHGTGTGTLTWSATVLPTDGLALNTATGVVSGTPPSQQTVSFNLTLSDTFGQSSAATPFTITINNPPAPVITTTQAQVTAAPATVQTPYAFAFHGTGTGTLTWSATGLPADGLSLNSSTGAVSGTPTTKQSVPFTLTLSDTFGQSSAATPFTITVNNPAPPVITTTPPQVPGGTVNIPYNFTFQGSGFAPLTWSTTPALTDSLSINASTGQVTGTPPTATTVSFSVTLTDGVGQQTTVPGFSIVVTTESIVFTPAAPSSVTAGGQLSVNATVSNDAGSGGVDWSVTCTAPSPCGSFSASHTTSGTATNYNAPPTPPVGGTVTITATAHDAPSPQVSAVVTINPATLIITTNSLPDGTVNASYNATITASGGVPPYTFTMDAGSTALPANLQFNPGSPSATITGTPTANGTTNNIIIDVADSEGSPMTAQMTFSITINSVTAACGSGSESLLTGQYAMDLQGFDSNGPVGIGGIFNLDGAGNVATTIGLEDINSSGPSGLQTSLAITSASSSYSVGSDHRGCLTIKTSAGTQTFRFSLSEISAGVASVAHIIEFDATGSNAAGLMSLQDPSAFSTAKISGNYAFGASGPEVGGSKFAIVGVLSLSGGAVGNTSVADFSDHGNMDGTGSTTYPASPVSFTGGSYNVANNGRGTLTIDLGTGSTGSIIYVLSSTEFLVLTTDSQTTDSLYVGSATQQSGGPFSAASMSGTDVLYATGLGNNGGTPTSLAFGAFFTITSSGTASIDGWSSGGGAVEAQSGSGLTFSVAANGRITSPAQAGNHQTPIMYLIKPNKGYILFTDGTNPNPKVQSGAFQPQTAGSYSTASLNATVAFGTIQPDLGGIDQEVGIATFDGAGNITGTSDDNTSGTLKANQPFTGTYSIASNGLGLVPANCTIGTNCDNVFFLISTTSFVLLDTSSDTNPDLEFVAQ